MKVGIITPTLEQETQSKENTLFYKVWCIFLLLPAKGTWKLYSYLSKGKYLTTAKAYPLMMKPTLCKNWNAFHSILHQKSTLNHKATMTEDGKNQTACASESVAYWGIAQRKK